jgi:hypothetical protein
VQQPEKVERFTTLLNASFDFSALYESLGIRAK